MDNLIVYIRPELLILAVILYFIGMGLKKIKALKDNFIPLILLAIGIVVGIIYVGIVDGWNGTSIVSGLVQGLLCASASVHSNQIIKQLLKLNNVDEKIADKIADTLVPEEKEKEEDAK